MPRRDQDQFLQYLYNEDYSAKDMTHRFKPFTVELTRIVDVAYRPLNGQFVIFEKAALPSLFISY